MLRQPSLASTVSLSLPFSEKGERYRWKERWEKNVLADIDFKTHSSRWKSINFSGLSNIPLPIDYYIHQLYLRFACLCSVFLRLFLSVSRQKIYLYLRIKYRYFIWMLIKHTLIFRAEARKKWWYFAFCLEKDIEMRIRFKERNRITDRREKNAKRLILPHRISFVWLIICLPKNYSSLLLSMEHE